MIKKRGQVTIFIIVAVIVVAVVALFFAFAPKLGIEFGTDIKNPSDFIQTCVEEDLNNLVKQISLHGGSLNPEFAFNYNYVNISYLCYTNQYYSSCVNQQPLLREHIEDEINQKIQETVDSCFNSMKQSYENKGFTVDIKPSEVKTGILPEKIVLFNNYSTTLTKEDSATYDSFNIMINNNLYESLGVVNSIIAFESNYGEADPTFYMTLYPDLRVIKNKRNDGTNIYSIIEKRTENEFSFATRGGVIPGGY